MGCVLGKGGEPPGFVGGGREFAACADYGGAEAEPVGLGEEDALFGLVGEGAEEPACGNGGWAADAVAVVD